MKHNTQGYNKGSRILLTALNALIMASSAIIVGILAYFVANWSARGRHIIYELVIAVVTLAIYLCAMVVPILKSYRGYLLPLTFVLSYLWLASLILTVQDYSGGRCRFGPPILAGRCGLKHTVEAFTIITFAALLLNSILDIVVYATHGDRHAAASKSQEPVVAPAPGNGADHGPAV